MAPIEMGVSLYLLFRKYITNHIDFFEFLCVTRQSAQSVISRLGLDVDSMWIMLSVVYGNEVPITGRFQRINAAIVNPGRRNL